MLAILPCAIKRSQVEDVMLKEKARNGKQVLYALPCV